MTRWKPDAEGRLTKAAITLFDEQGYDETTVAQIAEAAGLTKRTFFRYFSDKREVLFNGSAELQRLWLEAVAAAPEGASPLAINSPTHSRMSRCSMRFRGTSPKRGFKWFL